MAQYALVVSLSAVYILIRNRQIYWSIAGSAPSSALYAFVYQLCSVGCVASTVKLGIEDGVLTPVLLSGSGAALGAYLEVKLRDKK